MRNARSSGKIRLGEKGAADPDVPDREDGKINGDAGETHDSSNM